MDIHVATSVGVQTIAHGISNLGIITNARLIGDGYIFPFSDNTTATVKNFSGITTYDTTNVNFKVINDGWGGQHVYLILEYTKTTD